MLSREPYSGACFEKVLQMEVELEATERLSSLEASPAAVGEGNRTCEIEPVQLDKTPSSEIDNDCGDRNKRRRISV